MKPLTTLGATGAALLLAVACAPVDDANRHAPISLSMELPASLTGGPAKSLAAPGLLRADGTGGPCAYQGAGNDDPFKNGYTMTRFMVSAAATWTCIADLLIEIADYVPHDDAIHATDNQVGTPGYDADDPTHYRVSDDSETQTTIRLYYGYAQTTPPDITTKAQFYISWVNNGDGNIDGRLILENHALGHQRKSDDPNALRMDFDYNSARKLADMYLRFADSNEWADGFRVEVQRDLNVNPQQQVYLARGLMAMKRQFLPVDAIDEVPALKMYTVSDKFGDGAAIAQFKDMALSLPLNDNTGNHLGNYLFDKDDKYFFDGNINGDQPWDWIYKTITASSYRGSRTTPVSGGSWLPFNPSLDMIVSALHLPTDYFTGTQCAVEGDDCNALLNAIFVDGFAGQEPNQGQDPQDWRSSALAQPVYLESVYPNGQNWDGAFDHSYTP